MRALLVLLMLLVARASVVDRVVVVVDDELVMASDVAFEEVLAPLDDSALPFWRADHKSPEERLIDAAIIRLRSRSVTLYEADEDVVRDRMEKIRSHFRDRDEWQAWLQQWGLDEATLKTRLRHRVEVENYLTRNIQVATLDPVWLQTADALMDELRPGLRIRHVPLIGESP